MEKSETTLTDLHRVKAILARVKKAKEIQNGLTADKCAEVAARTDAVTEVAPRCV